MIDRFQEPDCLPETPEEREDEKFARYQQRKAAEKLVEKRNQERLEAAAKKAKSGDRKDLQNYLKLRKQLL